MPTLLRILDANTNRAREALRVMEEAARFSLDDRDLAAQCKHARHDLAQACQSFETSIHHRNTPGDVGTTLTTDGEQSRQSLYHVVTAAGKRLSEALRTLEEYGKVASATATPSFASTIESLRYRGYTLEQKLAEKLRITQPQQWQLCLLLTQALCLHHPWQDVLEMALDAGADCIQVREKNSDAQPLLKHARDVIKRTNHRATVIINDRPDVAYLADAHGVHLGQSDLNPQDVRKLAGHQLIIGVSTSNHQQAQRACENGADYCGVGPMYPTTTKTKKEIAGPDYLSTYLKTISLPHLAIGGIMPDNLGALTALGCQGIAVSSAICSASDPHQITCDLITATTTPIANTV